MIKICGIVFGRRVVLQNKTRQRIGVIVRQRRILRHEVINFRTYKRRRVLILRNVIFQTPAQRIGSRNIFRAEPAQNAVRRRSVERVLRFVRAERGVCSRRGG